MAMYQDCNIEEVLGDGGFPMEEGEFIQNYPTLPSFTPINPNRSQPHCISPQRTLLIAETDTQYETGAPVDSPPKPKRKKRGAPPQNKGRRVSLGAVWEYNDEGDIQAQTQDGGLDTGRKKGKIAAPKRSRSAKDSVNIRTHFENVEVTSLYQVGQKLDDTTEVPQLISPPDSNKKSKQRKQKAGKIASDVLKENPSQNDLLAKPLPQETGDQFLRSVKSHHGWTTTEDTVKANSSNSIAKTTLDKLASWRFRSSSTTQPPAVERNTQSCMETGDVEISIPEESLETQDELNHGLKQTFYTKPHDITAPNVHHLHKDHFIGIGLDSSHDHTVIQDPLSSLTTQEPLAEDDALASGPVWNDLYAMHQSMAHGEADSFEAFRTNGGVYSLMKIDQGPESLPRHPETWNRGSHSEIAPPCSSEQFRPQASPDHYRVLNQLNENGNLSGWQGLALQHKSSSSPEIVPMRLARHPNSIQVERSEKDECDIDPTVGVEGYYSDEFDEGLLDDDFLEMVPPSFIPDTQIPTKIPYNVNELDVQTIRKDSEVPTGGVGTEEIEFDSPSLHQGSDFRELRHPLTPNQESDFDDEFPVDEAEEEEMRKLAEITVGTKENFQAPASLQYAFADDNASDEVFDSSLQFSPVKPPFSNVPPKTVAIDMANKIQSSQLISNQDPTDTTIAEVDVDWAFLGSKTIQQIRHTRRATISPTTENSIVIHSVPKLKPKKNSRAKNAPTASSDSFRQSRFRTTEEIARDITDDSHEYEPLKPFARPDFPSRVADRCPIIGVSSQSFLRTCFRIGELLKEGARCEAMKLDAIIELFARVTFSSRESGTTKQHFQFADLWHDRPPFPNGVLMNYKCSALADSECKAFLNTVSGEGKMARCLGRLKRAPGNEGWLVHIINIRETDWEEIKWTKRIVSAELVKSEKM